jgi:hypothetical protein
LQDLDGLYNGAKLPYLWRITNAFLPSGLMFSPPAKAASLPRGFANHPMASRMIGR